MLVISVVKQCLKDRVRTFSETNHHDPAAHGEIDISSFFAPIHIKYIMVLCSVYTLREDVSLSQWYVFVVIKRTEGCVSPPARCT